MSTETFADAVLVLAGHGSTVDEDSDTAVWQHVKTLREAGHFAGVEAAFWKQDPSLPEILARVTARRVFIVPLFISGGYFAEKVIPRALGFPAEEAGAWRRVRRAGESCWYYAEPVGTHSGMTSVILARAREVVASHPFSHVPRPEETALFIAGHGTLRDENSRRSIEDQVELIRAQKIYAEVHPAFLEEAPRIQDCFQATQVPNLVMVPFFMSDGMHARVDIPMLLGETPEAVRQRGALGQWSWGNPTERAGKLLWYSHSVGVHPAVTDVVMARVREAACFPE